MSPWYHTTEQYSNIGLIADDRNGAIDLQPAQPASTVLRNTVARRLLHRFSQYVCSTSDHCDVDIQQFKACYTFSFSLTNKKLT